MEENQGGMQDQKFMTQLKSLIAKYCIIYKITKALELDSQFEK